MTILSKALLERIDRMQFFQNSFNNSFKNEITAIGIAFFEFFQEKQVSLMYACGGVI